jgi:hypothetical protein
MGKLEMAGLDVEGFSMAELDIEELGIDELETMELSWTLDQLDDNSDEDEDTSGESALHFP